MLTKSTSENKDNAPTPPQSVDCSGEQSVLVRGIRMKIYFPITDTCIEMPVDTFEKILVDYLKRKEPAATIRMKI